MTVAVTHLWRRLEAVTSFRSCSSSERGGVDAEVHGTVAVEHAGNTLRFHERGSATLDDGRRLNTTNVMAWSVADGVLSIAHERFGPGRIVPLVRLQTTADMALESEAPHICGDDRYTCTVRWADDAIEMMWTVRGPQKRATITTAYR